MTSASCPKFMKAVTLLNSEVTGAGETWMLHDVPTALCIIHQTEYECIENTSCEAKCCIRIIHTIQICTITNVFKQYKECSHKSQL